MKETFQNLVTYLKNPVLEKDTNTDLKYRFQIFFKILVISILTGFIITPIFALIQELQLVNMENHKLEEAFKDMGIPLMILIGAIIVPIMEEALFRGPITLFTKPKSFKIVFYFFALIFGFVHISNFELTTNVLLLSPILVLPQIILGGYLGYIRVRFGLQWSMLLHGTYNLFFLLISTIPEL
jgi:membrane protease YdiL (CAAX protease family)